MDSCALVPDEVLVNRWTTHGIHPASRLCEWNRIASSTFTPLNIDATSRENFNAVLETMQLRSTTIAHIQTQGSTVQHTDLLIAKHAQDPAFLLHYQVSGFSTNRQWGRDAILGPGDCTLVDSTRPYSLEFDDQTEFIVCRFSAEDVKRHLSSPEDCVSMPISGKVGATRTLRRLLDAIWEEGQSGGQTDEEWLSGTTDAVLSLLALAISSGCPNQRSSNTIFRMARDYIIESYTEPETCVSDLAAALAVSPRSLQKAFAQQGTTPVQYLQDIRIDKAKKLLEAGRHSVTDVCMSVGFSDLTHFGRVFRKRVGVSPSHFKRAIAELA